MIFIMNTDDSGPPLTPRDYVSFMSVIGLVLVASFLALVFIIKADADEQERWLQYRKEHKCRVVGEMDRLSKTPPITVWLCNDGKTHIR